MSEPKRPDDDKRSVERIEAERIYLEADGDIKLVDIASKLGISDSKVRKWKSMDDWEGKLHPSKRKSGKKKQGERSTSSGRERSTKKKENAPRNKGGQIGNKNAVGNNNSGNPFPVKPIKHGGYSKQYWAGLDEEEQRILDEINDDPVLQLTETIKLLTLREYRLRRAIEKYRDQPLYIYGTTTTKVQRKFKDDAERELYEERIQEKIDNEERLPGESETISTTTEATINIRLRLQRELTSVSSQKTKALEVLAKMNAEREGSGGDADAIKIWAEKIKIMRSKGGDS